MSGTALTACPHCGAQSSGRFCSDCGKALALENSEAAVARELLGFKPLNFGTLARTAWLALARPATLSGRWLAGDRQHLSSPAALIAMISALAAAGAVIASGLTGSDAAAQADMAALGNVVDAMPFLRGWFPAAAARAAADPAGFGEAVRQVGTWLAALWPMLFLVPGLLVLAPWRRVTRHHALIIACVETVTIMALAGLYTALRIAAPAIAANPLVTTVILLVLCVHTTRHIRRAVPGASLTYAATRPLLATLFFPVVVYVWIAGVTGLTLALLPVL